MYKRQMVEAGDVAGAQALILKELEIQTGSSAVAAGKTMTGQMEIMKNALGNVKEEIGGALLPVLTEMLNKFGPGFIEGASKFADWFVTVGLPALQNFGQFIEFQVYPVLDKFGKWFEVTILPILTGFVNFIIVSVIPALQTFGAWVDVNVIPVLQKFGNWFELHIIPALKTLATFVVETVIPALNTFGKWVEKNIFPILEKLAGLFMWSITDAIKTAMAIFETAKGVIQDIISFVDSLIAGIQKVLDMLPKLPTGGGTGAYGGTPPVPVGGGGYGGTPVTPPGGGGYGNTDTRGMNGGALTPITVNVYAAGGGPEFVRKAASQGVNEALRSRGYR